jgi:hypothetical protein
MFGLNLVLKEIEGSIFPSFPASFINIPVFKAQQFWVSLAETGKGMDAEGVSSGRNAGD